MCSAFTTERAAGTTIAETHTDATDQPTDLDSHADTCIVGNNAFIVKIYSTRK